MSKKIKEIPLTTSEKAKLETVGFAPYSGMFSSAVNKNKNILVKKANAVLYNGELMPEDERWRVHDSDRLLKFMEIDQVVNYLQSRVSLENE